MTCNVQQADPTFDPWSASAAARKAAPSPEAAPQAEKPVDNAWRDYCPTDGKSALYTGDDDFRGRLGGYSQRGPLGGGGGMGNRGMRDRSFRRGGWGQRLQVISWEGLDIMPVQKDFSFEHPAVSARKEEECDRIRTENSIHIVKNLTKEPVPKPICNFEEAPFPDWAAAELRQMGFERPTPIQVQAWPVLLKGFDFVGIAETGSGKTVAYVLPMLVHLMAQPELRPGEGPIGLVLVPTRDLCLQVARQVETFVGNTQIVCRALYGGEDISQQARDLAQRMDIAVATPGRLIALLNNRATNLRRATFVVLDEADELLGQGFGDQVRLILTQIRPDRQALMFSATWHKVVDDLALDVINQKPIHVNIGSTKLSACKSIVQRLHKLEVSESKFEALCKALDQISTRLCNDHGRRALVFCNHRSTIEPLVRELSQRGYPCKGFHGQQEQSLRDQTLQEFATPASGLWLLVCTQILGRGYDFTNVRYVINFDMPTKIVEYIHRIGRTGRAGQTGFSLTFFSPTDAGTARNLAMVLRESGQEVPTWLTHEARRYRRGGIQACQEHAAARAEAESLKAAFQGSQVPADWGRWQGRGRGRRDIFLAGCGGRGAARLPLAPDGPPIDVVYSTYLDAEQG